MKKITLLLAISILSLTGRSQLKTRNYLIDPALAPREHNVDFKHLRLELAFDPAKGVVRGNATLRFSPLQQKIDSIILDAINITVKEIKLNGKPVKYNNDNSFITIFPVPALTWGTTDSLIIAYEASPRKGLNFIGWNDPNNLSRKQIWSQGQGTDNRNWIPFYDEMNDKLTTELIVKFDKEYKVLSNGKFLGAKDNKDGTLTWHYLMSHPHAPYLVMLGIGKYDIKETRSASGVPMHLYYYPEWENRVETTYKYSERMVDFFEKEIGVKYPWESYSQIPVQDYMYGAMENTTATVFGDFFFVDERGYLDRYYIGVNAHELAHQWFGDFVTARSEAHHWLQESFATYYNQLFEREIFGDDQFDWARRNAQNSALEESSKNNFPVAHSEGGTVRHYPKGAFVLNMLKYVVGGKDAYNKVVKYYLEKHKYGNVDSQDLLNAFHETLGLSLDWFWEEWVYKGGEPKYNVTLQEMGNTVQFMVIQTQELDNINGLPVMGPNLQVASNDPFVSLSKSDSRPSGLYKMPVWFEVYYSDGTMDKKQVVIDKQSELVSISNPDQKKIDYVLFDPNNNILKSVAFNKPFEMLKAQALKAHYMLDRYDAVAAMRNIAIEKKRELLTAVYNKETFHAIKSEIIAQLVNDKEPKSVALIIKAISDKDVQVRKTALKEIVDPSPEMTTELEKLLTDSSYEIVASALDKLCYYNPAKTSAYLEATKDVEGTVGRNVTIKWLEIAYTSTGKIQHADKLVTYTGNSYEFRTRVNAMNALKKCNYFDIKMVDNLTDAILSHNSRLSRPAHEALGYFYEQNKYKKIISDHLASKPLSNWQRKKLEGYMSATSD
ncbi:MAG: M1 family metallopeptidase [Bacteroidetes bacterium]|nr:M1 family metallopeptidase [Bacteroidota bacterium]